MTPPALCLFRRPYATANDLRVLAPGVCFIREGARDQGRGVRGESEGRGDEVGTGEVQVEAEVEKRKADRLRLGRAKARL